MEDPNPYAASDGSDALLKKKKTVKIKIIDILFNNKVCHLVLLQDLSLQSEELFKEKEHKNLVAVAQDVHEKLTEIKAKC